MKLICFGLYSAFIISVISCYDRLCDKQVSLNNSSDLHYSDIIRASWHLKSLAIHMFVQQCMQSSREIHLWLADSSHKVSVMWRAFPCYDVFKWIKQNFTISNVLGLRLQKNDQQKKVPGWHDDNCRSYCHWNNVTCFVVIMSKVCKISSNILSLLIQEKHWIEANICYAWICHMKEH